MYLQRPHPGQGIEGVETAERQLALRHQATASGVLGMLLGFGIWCYSDRTRYKVPEEWSLGKINDIAGYLLNHWGPYVMLPLGVLILVWVAMGLRKKLLADEQGVGYAGRARIAWSEVDSLDARRLESKGVVVLIAAGRRLVLDSYYLTNFRELMALVDRCVPVEKHIQD